MSADAAGVGETAPEWWTSDDEAGRWCPDDFESFYLGDDVTATFRTSRRRRRTVIASLGRDADNRLVWAPKRRGTVGKLDADRLTELLGAIPAAATREGRRVRIEVPFGRRPKGHPVGGRTRRAVRKVEGLISEGTSQHDAIEQVRFELGWRADDLAEFERLVDEGLDRRSAIAQVSQRDDVRNRAPQADTLLREVKRERARDRRRDQ